VAIIHLEPVKWEGVCDTHLGNSVYKRASGLWMMSKTSSKIDHNDPLSVIAHDRSRLYEICDELEQIADQLGGQVNVQLCTSILNSLRHELPLYHRDEETLFNLLLKRKPADKVLAKCIELAISEHSTIESYAFELAEPLGNMIARNGLRDVEAVGYLLRYSFEVYRQHLRWEDATIFDEMRYVVRDADKVSFQAGLVRNRHNMPDRGLHIVGRSFYHIDLS